MTDSPFILSKIKTTSYENKKYIEELIRLLKYINNGVYGFASGQIFHILRERYPTEYLALLKETNSPEYEEILEEMEKETAETLAERRYEEENRERLEAEVKKFADEEHAKWIALGGQP